MHFSKLTISTLARALRANSKHPQIPRGKIPRQAQRRAQAAKWLSGHQLRDKDLSGKVIPRVDEDATTVKEDVLRYAVRSRCYSIECPTYEKCQETHPACGHCTKTGLKCEYPSTPQITHQVCAMKSIRFAKLTNMTSATSPGSSL